MRIEFSQICGEYNEEMKKTTAHTHKRKNEVAKVKRKKMRTQKIKLFSVQIVVNAPLSMFVCEICYCCWRWRFHQRFCVFATVVPSSDFEMCKYYFVIYVWWFCRINFHFPLTSSCCMRIGYSRIQHCISSHIQKTQIDLNSLRFFFRFCSLVCLPYYINRRRKRKKGGYQNAIKMNTKTEYKTTTTTTNKKQQNHVFRSLKYQILFAVVRSCFHCVFARKCTQTTEE